MNGMHPFLFPVLLILVSLIPVIVLGEIGIYLFPVIYDSLIHNINHIILFLIFLVIFSVALSLSLIILLAFLILFFIFIFLLKELLGDFLIVLVLGFISVLKFISIISQKIKDKYKDEKILGKSLFLSVGFIILTVMVFVLMPFVYTYILGFPRLFVFENERTGNVLYVIVFAENNKYVYYYPFEDLIKIATEDGEYLKDILCDQQTNPTEKIEKFINHFFTLTWEDRLEFLKDGKKEYYRRKVIKHMKKYPAEDFWKNVILTNEDYYYKSLIENFQNSICSKR